MARNTNPTDPTPATEPEPTETPAAAAPAGPYVYAGPFDEVSLHVGDRYVTVARGETAPEGIDPSTLSADWVPANA